VFGWACNHYKAYGQAPGVAALNSLFIEWSQSADKTTKLLVEKFLLGLRPVEMNADYCLDLLERLFVRNETTKLINKVQAAMSNGHAQAATDLIQKYKPTSFAEQADYVSPLEDQSSVITAYDKTKCNSLVKFPVGTPLAQWIEPVLHSDALVSFIGAEKMGKSVHLAMICIRGVIQGKRVAFFNLGDLSENQCLRRWTTSLCGKPVYQGKYRMPESITIEEKELKVEFSHRHADAGYSQEEATAAWKAVAKRGDTSRLRIVSKPAGTFSVSDLDRKLDAWANKGWLPDVVGVDYFGLLARPKGLESHEAMDADWAGLRMLSTKYKILLLTASQTKAAGYGKRWLGREDFSGSKGINAHTNAVIGINMDEMERANQVCRLNYVVVRESEFLTNLPSRYIAVAGCPAIGRFHVKSAFI